MDICVWMREWVLLGAGDRRMQGPWACLLGNQKLIVLLLIPVPHHAFSYPGLSGLQEEGHGARSVKDVPHMGLAEAWGMGCYVKKSMSGVVRPLALGLGRKAVITISYCVWDEGRKEMSGKSDFMDKKVSLGCWVVCTPLIPALQRQRQVGLCKFKARLVSIVNSRTVRVT